MIQSMGLVSALVLATSGASGQLADTPKEYLLHKAAGAITVDGKLDEWDMAATPYVLSGVGKLAHVRLWHMSNNALKGDADSSARAAIAWDETYLYVAGQVTDDHLRGVLPESTGNQGPNGWQCDSLMIAIDSFRQPMKSNYPTSTSPFIALRYAPMGKDPRGKLVGRTYPISTHQKDLNWKLPPGSLWQVRETPDGYNVEAAIPWKWLGFTARPGERVMVAFMLADTDPGESLIQTGWWFTADPKDHAPFRLVDRNSNRIGLLTTSNDEITTAQAWAVRAELDAVGAPAKLDAVRVVGAASGKAVAQETFDLAVPMGKTGTVLWNLKAGRIAAAGDYVIELVGRAGKEHPTVVARFPIQVVEPAAALTAVQMAPGQVRHLSPGRIAHDAVLDHQRGLIRHGFVTGKADYVPCIRKWVIPGLKKSAQQWIDGGRQKLFGHHRNSDVLALQCIAAHQVTGDPEYARMARDLMDLELEAQLRFGLESHKSHWFALVRYVTWARDPKSPYAPKDAEKRYRQIYQQLAANPPAPYFLESGMHNRVWHYYVDLKLARIIAEEDDAPVSARLIEHVDYHDKLIGSLGDSHDASSNYHWVWIRKAFNPVMYTGKWKEFFAVKGYRRAMDRYSSMVSPSGAFPQFGDDAGWPSLHHVMWPYELMGRVTGDGRYRWAAHRAAEYIYNHCYQRVTACGYTHDKIKKNFVVSYLVADDSVKPVAPTPASHATWRNPTIKLTAAARAARPGLPPTALDAKRQIPDKAVLKSGNNPQGLWGLVDLLPVGGHAGELPGDLFALTFNDATLLAGQGYNEHYPDMANVLWVEDLEGVPADPRYMDVSVPIFIEDPAFTFVRVTAKRYQHLPVTVTRDILFYKGGVVIVKDRATFHKSMKTRLGPGFQTRCLGPECGPNWFNTYYDQMYMVGGTKANVHRMRNPAWDLLVYFCPRPGRKHTVGDRFADNPWQCSPIRVRQSWAGMPAAGQTFTFTTVLLPHAPVLKPSQLIDPPADAKHPKYIEIFKETDEVTVLKAVIDVEPARPWRNEVWIMLNNTGKLVEAGPLASDGTIAVIGKDYNGRLRHRAVAGGKVLRFDGKDESAKARKVDVRALELPASLKD